jgi:hypothetical protein
MTGVTFASAITGTISALYIYSCNITETLDLSKFTSFTTLASIWLYSNPLMTGVTFASAITGTITYLHINSCNITGTLDLSMFTSFTTSASIQLYTNPLMTGITFANSITGKLRYLYMSNCSLYYVNLLGFSSGTAVASCDIEFQNNAMTAAIVNRMLADINAISASGYSYRKVIANGTNAAPDASSGGYNGLAAKTALQGKAFTVTTN